MNLGTVRNWFAYNNTYVLINANIWKRKWHFLLKSKKYVGVVVIHHQGGDGVDGKRFWGLLDEKNEVAL